MPKVGKYNFDADWVCRKKGHRILLLEDGESMEVEILDPLTEKKIRKPFINGYVKFANYDVDEVLPFITRHTSKMTREYDGIEVKMNSLRYECFEKYGLQCVACGIRGEYFTLERDLSAPRFHFNLYAKDYSGREVMMTKDHIIPKSRGGSDTLQNMQTMCFYCNKRKSDRLLLTDWMCGKFQREIIYNA